MSTFVIAPPCEGSRVRVRASARRHAGVEGVVIGEGSATGAPLVRTDSGETVPLPSADLFVVSTPGDAASVGQEITHNLRDHLAISHSAISRGEW